MTSALGTTVQPQNPQAHAVTTTVTTKTTTTFLRVKRPRHLDPLSTLHLDLSSQNKQKRSRKSSNDEIEDLSQLMRQSTYVSGMQQHAPAATKPKSVPPSTVVWKRVRSDSADTKYSNHHKNNATHKRIRYVDARLDDDIEEEGDDQSTRRVKNSSNYHGDDGVATPTTKRRRLALTLLQPGESSTKTTPNSQQPSSSSTTNKKNTAIASPTKQNAILDPLSRLVDDSLQSVISGTKPLATHLDFIMTDSRLESSHPQSQTKWLCWSTKRMKRGGGTVLHAAALYNELSSTTRILSMISTMTPQPSCSSTSALQILLTETDKDGRTPYKIAKLIGHDGIVQVLEAFGANYYEDQEELRKKKEKEENDFVYDVFCLQEEEHALEGQEATATAKNDINTNPSNTQKECSTPDTHNTTSAESICTHKAHHPASTNNDNSNNAKVVNVPEVVELRGGIGYWDEHGELVLEAVGGGFESDESVMDKLDDDIDSNCEDHDRNDYPDEDEEFSDTDDWGGGIIRDDDDDDDDDSSNDANEYRHRSVYMNGGTSNSSIRNITTSMGQGGLGGLVAGGTHMSSRMYSNTAATVGDDDDYYNNSFTEYEYENEDNNDRLYAYDPELDDDGNYSD